MSLIADALKTAQRERERRSAHEGPSAASVLIPLREPRFRVRPAAVLTLLGVAVAAVAATVILRGRTPRALLPPLSPATSAILRDALADSARATAPTPRRAVATAPSFAAAARVTGAAQQAVAISRDTAPVLQGQPDTLREVSQAEAASGELSVAVQSGPSVERLFSLAVARHRVGDVASARAMYQRVLVLVPDHADALNNLGVIFSGEQEYDRALELLRRAAALSPKNAGTWNNIGTALREQGRSDDAISAFRHALRVDPGHEGAHVGLAQQYLAIGALAQARSLLDQVVADHPTHAEAHYTLGQVLERQGDRAAAVRAYTTFVNVAPPRLSAHADRVRQHLETMTR
jgi:Tfp pilus assembly protein PilF